MLVSSESVVLTFEVAALLEITYMITGELSKVGVATPAVRTAQTVLGCLQKC